jgi:DNA/RNA-binding domain of Phe-tRNA-synthetase-like protein
MKNIIKWEEVDFNKSTSALAHNLRVAKSSISRARKRYAPETIKVAKKALKNIEPKRKKINDIDVLKSYISTNGKFGKMLDELKCSPKTLRKIMRKLELKPKRAQYSTEELLQAIEKYGNLYAACKALKIQYANAHKKIYKSQTPGIQSGGFSFGS